MMEDKTLQGYVAVYTREALPEEYPGGLARSVHFAYSLDGKNYRPWNKNYGILFAEARIREDDTLCPRGVRAPWIFRESRGYGIAAVRVLEDGAPEHPKGADVLIWHTEDFIEFEKCGTFFVEAEAPVEELRIRSCRGEAPAEEICSCGGEAPAEEICNCGGEAPAEKIRSCGGEAEERGYGGAYKLCWRDSQGGWYGAGSERLQRGMSLTGERLDGACPDGVAWVETSGISGAEPGNCAAVCGDVLERAVLRWSPVKHIYTECLAHIDLDNQEELDRIPAVAVYSDGSAVKRDVRWTLERQEGAEHGACVAKGELQTEQYTFPLAVGYGDPVIFPWNGSWYFVGTNDNVDDIGLYARKADSVAGLFEEDVRCQILLDRDEERGFIQTFWAPEFHVIGGELYLLFAVSGKVWGPQCHLMKLKKGGEILNPKDWEEPVRIRRKDGSWLAQDGITLDMTYLKGKNASYMVWSYRRNIGTEKDTGSMLYIAEIDEATPWQLKSEPVLLSRPLYGWENVNGTINNEGPNGFVKDGRIYLGYSGGAANSYTYAVGLLTADWEADLLRPENWNKADTPVLSFYSVEREYGPGHHSFFVNEQGELMIAYHAEDALEHTVRCDGIRRVHFDVEGRPRFDLSNEDDRNPACSTIWVKATLNTSSADW